MADPAESREAAIELQVRRGIRGGTQIPVYDATTEIDQNDTFGRQVFIVNTGGLDGDHTIGTVDSADIAPGKDDQAMFLQIEIGLVHLLFELVVHG
jgi:hypothetical protein